MTREEFHEKIQLYGDSIFRTALHCLRHVPDAEDVTQNVLLKLYRNQTPFASPEHEKHWVLRVTVNECKKLRSSAWFRHTVSMVEYQLEHPFQEPGQSELFLAVMSLPSRYRIAVYLYYYEDYSVREISEMLGRKESTVQTHLMRARKLLKEKLQEEWSYGNETKPV